MGALLGFAGILSFLFCLILTVVLLLRKKPAKKSTIGIAVSLAVIVVGFAITPESTSVSLNTHNSVIAELESITAEYSQYKKDMEGIIKVLEAEKIAALAQADASGIKAEVLQPAPETNDATQKIDELESELKKLEAENKSLAEKLQSAQTKINSEKPDVPDSQAATSANKYTLGSGNYTSGTDFDAGTYDIVAISGSGNVSSTNMFTGGINAMMGNEPNLGGLEEMFEKEYKNIKLPRGTELSVSGGVTIEIIKK